MEINWPKMTLGEVIDLAAERYPSQEAIVLKDRRITYARLKEAVDTFSENLCHIGVKRGDKVSIWMVSCPEWIIAQFAIAKLGAVMVAVNTRFKLSELEYILTQSDTSTLIMMGTFRSVDFLKMISELCPEIWIYQPNDLKCQRIPLLQNLIVTGEKRPSAAFKFTDLLNRNFKTEHDEWQNNSNAVQAEDIACILYTSGTFSFPKGAMIRHGSLIANAFQTGRCLGLSPEDRYFVMNPLFSIAGCGVGVLADFTHGSTLVLQESFQAEEALNIVKEEGCTVLRGFDTNYLLMSQVPDAKLFLKSVRLAQVYPASPAAKKIITEDLGIKEIDTGYGLTEASGPVCQVTLSDPPEYRCNTEGKPHKGVEVKIVDPDTGKILSPNRTGEICVRGYTVMAGYYRRPEETNKVIDTEGWLHTGDLGILNEEGYLKFRRRLKDVYKSGGFNVSCSEVEEFLRSHPKIRQACVVSIPDQKMGEVGVAFLELKKDQECSFDEVFRYCRERIANYKVPKYCHLINTWPMTGSGKVQKFVLKEIAEKKVNGEIPLNDLADRGGNEILGSKNDISPSLR